MAKKRSVFDDDNDSDIVVEPKKEKVKEKSMENNEVKNETKTTPSNNGVVNNAVNNTPPPPTKEETTATNYNPLDGEVKKRDYALGNTNEPVVERVPEPIITNLPPPPPPPITDQPKPNPQDNPYAKPLNPDMAFVPPKDQRLFSTMLVDAILSGYKQFWGFAYDYVKVSDEQIVDWVMQDKISLDITVPINEHGEEVTLREVYNMFNSQAKEALTVSDAFVDSVRESMIREFTRRGWGISDMQNIIQAFIRDAGAKGIAVYQLKATMNQFTKSVMKQHDELKKLREEITNIKEKVVPNEPTVIRREKEETSTPTSEPIKTASSGTKRSSKNGSTKKETYKDTVSEAVTFIEKYEIVPNQEPSKEQGEEIVTQEEPHIKEVPVYDGEEDIQPNEDNDSDLSV